MKRTLFDNARLFMESGEFKKGAVLVEKGCISKVFSEEETQPMVETKVDLQEKMLVPGFIDTHIHGFAGFSAQEQSKEDILGMCEKLPLYGVTSFVPTISRTTADKEEILNAIKAVVAVRGKERGAHILGIHLEGPFLSLEKKGGQSAPGIIAIDLNFMEELWQASKGSILTMTVAPELENIESLVEYCRQKGIILQAGHTNANYDQMKRAIQLGIRHMTHTFNAMTGLHHRQPGVIGACLEDDTVSCEIIGDGYHVHPAAVRILTKCKPAHQIVLITDSLKYSKTNIKSYIDGGIEYMAGNYFYKKEDGTLVGSNISLHDAVRNFVSWGIPLEKTLLAVSTNPATVLKLSTKGKIKEGYDADFAILNDDLTLHGTVISGCVFK